MTDTAVTDDIILVYMQRPGVDGTGIGTAEKAQLVNDVAAALARANITGVAAIPDVVLGTLANNDVLVYTEATGTWTNGKPPGSIDGVYTPGADGYEQVSTDTIGIYVSQGITARAGTAGPQTAVLELVFGGTGSGAVVAHDNHTHEVQPDEMFTLAASGAHSSGTRPLAGGTVTGLDASKTYVLKGRLEVDLRGQGAGAGYTMPSITIAGTKQNRPQGESRTVSGVDMPYGMMHAGVTVSGVSSVTVSSALQYQSGDPVYVGGSALFITIEADR